jgi:hypothetical protein
MCGRRIRSPSAAPWPIPDICTQGVNLDRALLTSCVGADSALLRSLVDAARENVLVAHKRHADDTQVLARARQRKNQSHAPLAYVRGDCLTDDLAQPTA